MNNNNEIGQFIIIYSNKTSVNVVSLSQYFTVLCLPFCLKEALQRISLTHPKCQRHYFGTLGSLLRKIRVT